MNDRFRTIAAAALLAVAGATAFAQADATPGVDQRQANQAQRIESGAASGRLTPRETRRLQRQQAAIERAENRAKSDGDVTPAERRRLHHAQNRASRDIRRQKHDPQVTPRP